ncbi:MAG: alkaline phosphatase family protein [Planctomycetales bacterium]
MTTPKNKVLLVGWDAADWKVITPLMDQGLMPHVERLVNQGTMGQIATLHPPLSPMLWTSIATGKRPFKHGIHGFSEPTQDGRGVQPVTNLSRTCKAVWNIFNQNDLRSIVIGWWPSHPAEPLNGVTVSDHFHRAKGKSFAEWPLMAGAVHPESLRDALAEIRLHPSELVGDLLDFLIPLAREIDQSKDRRLKGCAKTLCECVTIHSAATWLLDHEPWDFFAVYYDAIDHFCHGFMKYHPPKQEWISDRDFELYQHVVSMAYRLHDQMLGTLLAKVPADTTVILMSDHGFHPDHLRPKFIPRIPAGPAVEHRDFGILALRGPAIKQDELLHGASVLDIAPTLLTLYGLPVGGDMDGKVLTGAFEYPPVVQTIPTWEEVPGNDGRHPPHTRLDPVAAQESLDQLVALGYIEKPDADHSKAVAKSVQELQYNLGEAYQDADRHHEALQIFRTLHAADPDEQRLAVHRFTSAQALGLLGEMQEVVADLDGRRRRLYEQAVPRLKEFASLVRERKAQREAQRNASREETFPTGEPPEEPDEPEAEIPDSANVNDDELLLQQAEREGARYDAAARRAKQAEAEPASPAAAERPRRPPLLTSDERQELAECRRLSRFAPHVVDYLKGQVLALQGRHAEALEALTSIPDAQIQRPGLLLQTGQLYQRLNRWNEAAEAFGRALALDPDNSHAHLGMCRVYLQRKRPEAAAQSALNALERIYHYPMAHYLLGVSLTFLREPARAAGALRQALILNPNFPEAHRRLARLLQNHLNDPAGARKHRQIYRQMRQGTGGDLSQSLKAAASVASGLHLTEPLFEQPSIDPARMPPVAETITIVSGLPRSGTSMVMQMLAAGGMPILTDGLRAADDDNPQGYFEFEPVKSLHGDARWLEQSLGKAVKIVAPVLRYLPEGIPCRIVLIERHLDEILSSQEKMVARRGEPTESSPERRARLREEYARLMVTLRSLLRTRPQTHVLCLRHDQTIADPRETAEALDRFHGGLFDVEKMVAAVRPDLHRQRTGS